MIKSLKAQGHELSDARRQLEVLERSRDSRHEFVPFGKKLKESGLLPLKPVKIDTLQVNVGKMCNQTCKHCHVDAGPDRKEIMTRETMEQCLQALSESDIPTVDLTGGAPEMNPHFRWFVEQVSKQGREIMVRCNLTIIVANPKYHDLPDFYKEHSVKVVSSLPYFAARRTDSQRGEGVFEKSIQALLMLNEVGYGLQDSGLILDLVYNPGGAFLPSSQDSLEKEFKTKLKKGYDIEFNNLLAITNLPISRFLDYLLRSGNYTTYMEKLIDAFNPVAARQVMCRSTISVGWDGSLYDCDFNQMLALEVEDGRPRNVKDFNQKMLEDRNIVINQHCYGCTAGAGSSCGGSII